MKMKNFNIVESLDGSLFSLEPLAKIQDNWIQWVLNTNLYKIEDKKDSKNWYPAILVDEDCWDFFVANGQECYSSEDFNYIKSEIIVKDYLEDPKVNFTTPKKKYYHPDLYIYYKNSEGKNKWFAIPVSNKKGRNMEQLFEPLKYIWIEWLENSVYKLLLPQYPED